MPTEQLTAEKGQCDLFVRSPDPPPPPKPTWKQTGQLYQMYFYLCQYYPSWCSMLSLNEICERTFTRRISDLREYLRPLGWYVEWNEDTKRSCYRLVRL